MSSGKRIKQIRQKTFNNGFLPIPFGADGNFIDMFSGLDLEEELKIGGNHYVQIESGEFDTTIVEYYSNKPITNPTENLNDITHKVTVTFDSGSSYWSVDGQDIFITFQDVMDSSIIGDQIILETQQEEKQTIIRIVLSKRNPNQASEEQYIDIHSKVITITQTPENGITRYKINEVEREVTA